MTMPVEPCQWCAAPTARWCGSKPCCWSCHTKRCSTPASRGAPGRVRRDHGDDQHDLTCVACGATWVGPAWEPCDWCQWEREPVAPHVDYVPGVLQCDRCGAIRLTKLGWYELAVHGCGETEQRDCNGWMRRITRSAALRLLADS